jgi:FOG: CheY-like receiver
MTFRRYDRNGPPRSGPTNQDSVQSLCNDIDILAVEDNPADVRLLKEVFSECRHDLLCVTRGRKMPEILARIRKNRSVSPALVLLDLNLPGCDGFDVLERVKSANELQGIRVVVFSGSASEADISRAYKLGANAYVTKPTDVDEHLSTLEAISEFWLSGERMTR